MAIKKIEDDVMTRHPSDAELYAFFFQRPGQKAESLVDITLTKTNRNEVEQHLKSCRSCGTAKKKESIETSRAMGRIFAAFAISDELCGGDQGEDLTLKRRRKLLKNLRSV